MSREEELALIEAALNTPRHTVCSPKVSTDSIVDLWVQEVKRRNARSRNQALWSAMRADSAAYQRRNLAVDS